MGKAHRHKPTVARKGNTLPAPRTIVGLQQRAGLLSNPLFVFVVLTLLASLVYLNALPNQFVFDDYELVVENRQIRSLTKIPDILGFGDAPRRYRPVRFVSYSFDYFFFGLDPRGYHLFNLVYHALTTFLVYLIVRHLLDHPRVALLAAILFAVHPIQTDAVTYISGRRDVLSTLFYLLGFYAFLRYRIQKQVWYLGLVCAAFILGLFTKEMVVTLPVMMLCYDWYRHFPTDHARVDLAFCRTIVTTLWSVIRTYARLYVPIFVLAGLFLFEKLVLNNPSRMEGLYGSTYVHHGLSICRIFATYIKLLCFPVTLNADYSYNAFPVTTSLVDPAALGSVLLLLAVAVALLTALQSQKQIAFAGLWFFITLLPVSQIVPHHEPMAEHYLYLPSVGFCLLVALGVERLLTSVRTRPVAYAAFGILVILLSLRTVVRNGDWRDDLTLWEKTVQTAPHSSRAHQNLGTEYARRGEFDRAIAQFRQALRIWPQNPRAHYHLGNAYFALGRLDKARTAYQAALRHEPDLAQAYFHLGRVWGKQGHIDQALETLQQAVRLRPHYARAHHELGTAYYKKGLVEKAREQYLRTLEIDPKYTQAYRNLGIIYRQRQELEKAMSAYQALLRLDPQHVGAHLALASLYGRSSTGQRQALEHLRQVLTLAPDHPQASAIQSLVEALRTRAEHDQ